MMGDHVLRPTLILSSYGSHKDFLGPHAESERGDNDEQTTLRSGLLSLSLRLGPQTHNIEVIY